MVRAIYLQNSIVKGLGTSGKREDALAIYAENEAILLSLLDNVKETDHVILAASLGGGVGSVAVGGGVL